MDLTELVRKRRDRPRPITNKLTRYEPPAPPPPSPPPRKKTKKQKKIASKRKLKGMGVTITESFTVKRMEHLKKAREEHGFTNMWTTDGRILFKCPNEKKSNLFMIKNQCGVFALYMNGKAFVAYIKFIGGIMHHFLLSKKIID